MGYIPLSMGGAYPGLYLFTSPSRFVRPVRNISVPSDGSENIELIGPFEQVNIAYLSISCDSFSSLELLSLIQHLWRWVNQRSVKFLVNLIFLFRFLWR